MNTTERKISFNFIQFHSISLLSNFSFIAVTDFEVQFKILIFSIWNLNPNLKLLIFDIALTYYFDANANLSFKL